MYKPGDIVIVKVKISSRIEKENNEVLYEIRSLSSTWGALTIKEEDIEGSLEVKMAK